jgi:hypothetical protein
MGQHRTRHGLHVMRRQLSKLTTTRLDGRSAVAVAVRTFKGDVVKDLGGDLSRLQETVLESAAQKWLLAKTLADYIGRQPSLVTKKRQLLPVVEKYVRLLDSLERTCERLGLQRVPAVVEDLHSYLERRSVEQPEPKGAEPDA